MKTIKQIADEIGVSKQKVYRYIRKNHINGVHHEAHHDALHSSSVMYYDEAVESLIIQYFTGNKHINEVHHEAHQAASSDAVIDVVVTMLQQELNTKNKLIDEQQQTIRELTSVLEHTTESLHAAQALHAGTMQKTLTSKAESEERGFFARIFTRRK